jgi:hypothetical protein
MSKRFTQRSVEALPVREQSYVAYDPGMPKFGIAPTAAAANRRRSASPSAGLTSSR